MKMEDEVTEGKNKTVSPVLCRQCYSQLHLHDISRFVCKSYELSGRGCMEMFFMKTFLIHYFTKATKYIKTARFVFINWHCMNISI